MPETIRLATWNVELARKGPGLLVRDLMRMEDPQIIAVLELLRIAQPDVLVLQGVDYDLNSAALERLAQASDFPHFFAARPNAGWQAGLDVDGDGRLGEPEDALGYGNFAGQGGMAILSRYQIDRDAIIDHSAFPWRSLPDRLLPEPNETWPDAAVHARLPLSSMAHWEVPLIIGKDRLHLWTFHAAPPVFDGPEDRNGRRNHDEIAFWIKRLDGLFGAVPDDFVLLGDFNLDPDAGDGRRDIIKAVLADPRLQDPAPQGASGRQTVNWESPGRMRVSYILPARHLAVQGSGVLWPADEDALAAVAAQASRHRLVWVDIALP